MVFSCWEARFDWTSLEAKKLEVNKWDLVDPTLYSMRFCLWKGEGSWIEGFMSKGGRVKTKNNRFRRGE